MVESSGVLSVRSLRTSGFVIESRYSSADRLFYGMIKPKKSYESHTTQNSTNVVWYERSCPKFLNQFSSISDARFITSFQRATSGTKHVLRNAHVVAPFVEDLGWEEHAKCCAFRGRECIWHCRAHYLHTFILLIRTILFSVSRSF